MIFLHPRDATLNRFADGALDARGRERVARHLSRCVKCRLVVARIRDLGHEARALVVDRAPPEILDRALARRSAGERVILPVGDPPEPSRVGAGALIAGSLLALVTAAVVTAGWVTRLSADRSDLRFTPPAPRQGSEISVEYRPTTMLAREARLILRARFRSPRARTQDTLVFVAATLLPGRGGVFRGAFTLPDSVVYAAFAVEDAEGQRIDSNSRRLWELLTHQSDGKPTIDALRQKRVELQRRDWLAAYATARLATELHPESPAAWSDFEALERSRMWPDPGDTTSAARRLRFLDLDRRLRGRPTVSGDELSWMMWYANAIGDRPAAAYWQHRLEAEAPDHVVAVQIHALAFEFRYRSEPRVVLAEFERIWQSASFVHPQVSLVAYQVAVRNGLPAEVHRWWSRMLMSDPSGAIRMALDLAGSPATRRMGIDALRGALGRGGEGASARRPLTSPLDEHAAAVVAAGARVLAALGKALVESGDSGAGMDTLILAEQAGAWDPAVFRLIADGRLVVRDTMGAARMLGNVTVDPSVSPEEVRRSESVGAGLVGREVWERLVAEGRDRMQTHVLRRSIAFAMRGDIALTDLAGGRTTLRSLIDGGLTVVAVWSRYGEGAVQRIARVQQLADRLAADGVTLVVITLEKPSDDTRRFLSAAGVRLEMYSAGRGDAFRSLQAWGTPEYFVLDGIGRVRFDHTLDEAEMLRQLEVLRALGEPVSASYR